MKQVFKAILNQVGLDVRRKPRPGRRGSANGLAFYHTALGDVYLPTDAPLDSIAAKMRVGQVFEPEVVDLARRFIRKGSTVLDVGSNFGQMAMLFSREVGEDGRVYAFEAQRRVYEILCKNLKANDIVNVFAQYGAVFHEAGRVFHFPEPDFQRFEAFGSYNLPLEATQGPEVTSVRIDDYVFDRPITFMKIDVQGCDLYAMRGAVDTIRAHQMPILFEFEQRFQVEYGTSFQDYVEFVSEIGYRFAETILDINFLIVPKNFGGGTA